MKIKMPQQIETSQLIIKKHSLESEYIQLWVDSINNNLNWLNQFLSRFNEPITLEKQKLFWKAF